MRSQADIIMSHVPPSQIQSIPLDFDEVLNRLMEFNLRHDFSSSKKYEYLTQMYAKEMYIHEKKLNLSYSLWNEEVLYKFEVEFARKYINGLNLF